MGEQSENDPRQPYFFDCIVTFGFYYYPKRTYKWTGCCCCCCCWSLKTQDVYFVFEFCDSITLILFDTVTFIGDDVYLVSNLDGQSLENGLIDIPNVGDFFVRARDQMDGEKRMGFCMVSR